MSLNFLKSPITTTVLAGISIASSTVLWAYSEKTILANSFLAGLTVTAVVFNGYYVYKCRKNRRKESYEEIDRKILINKDVAYINSALRNFIKYLKASKYLVGDSLYEMPWYFIVGKSQSGKSTLLEKNKFDHIQLNTDILKNSNYDYSDMIELWVNDSAVVIEVGSKIFGNGETNQYLLNKLISAIKISRPRQSLNGIIATMDIKTILSETKKEQKIHANRIQKLVVFVNQKTNLNIPLYTVFTRADLLADFSVFFSCSRESDTSLPLGVTVPIATKKFDPDYLSDEIDNLLKSIIDQQLHNLRKCKHNVEVGSVVAFPYQMKILISAVKHILFELNNLKRVSHQVWFRGVYFVSSEQQGKQLDVLSKNVADVLQFGMVGNVMLARSGKSFFCNNLFEKIFISESDIVGVSPVNNRNFLMIQALSIAVSVAVIIGVGVRFIDNWGDDEKFRSFSAAQLQLFDKGVNDLGEYNVTLNNVIPLLMELRKAAKHEYHNYPWYRKISVKQAYNESKVRSIYIDQLQMLLLPRLSKVVADELKFNIEVDNTVRTFQLLYFYKMLQDPSRMDNKIVSNYLLETLGSQQQLTDLLLSELKMLVNDLLQSDYESSLRLDKVLMKKAENKLAEVSPSKLIFEIILGMPEYRELVNASEILGDQFSQLFHFDNKFKSTMIPKVYTVDGYNEVDLTVKSLLLESLIFQYKLVMNEDVRYEEGVSMLERIEFSRDLQKLFYAEYVRVWKRLVAALKLRDFNNIESLSEAVKLAARPDGPIRQLLDAITMNTNLAYHNDTDLRKTSKAAKLLGLKKTAKVTKKIGRLEKNSGLDRNKLLEGQPSSVVNNAFLEYASFYSAEGNNSIEGLLKKINDLSAYTDSALTSPVPDETWFKYAMERANGSQTAIVQLQSEADKAPTVIADVIKAIADQTWYAIMERADLFINKLWKDEIISFYQEAIEGRFPFDMQGRDEVVLADFIEFFKPHGKLDTFVQEYFSPFLQISYNRLQKKVIDGRQLSIPDSLLDQLRQTQMIRRQFFGPTGQVMAINFKIRAVQMSSDVTGFEMKGNQLLFSYHQGPRVWKTISWPQATSDRQLNLVFYKNDRQLSNKLLNGEWAFFRMFFTETENDKTLSSRTERLNVNFGNNYIKLELENEDRSDVLGNRAFLSFSLPKSLSN